MAAVEQIKIKRLDVQHGTNNLILFNSMPSNIINHAMQPRRTSDNEKAEHVALQEQKLKLEKLKWHQNTIKLVSTSLKPKQVISNENKNIMKKNTPSNEMKNSISNERPKIDKTSKHVVDVLEERTKKASVWLHHEQEEVYYIHIINYYHYLFA